MVPLIDSHAHLDAPEFANDLPDVLVRMRVAGVAGVVVPAVQASDFSRLIQLAETHGWRVALGLHPMFLGAHQDTDLDVLGEALRERSSVVAAVGECGLDYYVDGLDRARQQFLFAAQIELAVSHCLPLIIHARRAHEAVLLTLKRYQPPAAGVIHSYAGSIDQAQALYALGFKLGIGGPLTYPRANRLREVARALPLDAFVIETDAPDQPLYGHQGERNEPARLPGVLSALAAARGEPVTHVAAVTRATTMALFGGG
jgi:TatD DNase family protein